jgi:hypothetical protein
MALQFTLPPPVEPGQMKLDDYGKDVVNSWMLSKQMALKEQEGKVALAKLDQAMQEHKDLQKYRQDELSLRQQDADSLKKYREDEIKVRQDDLKNRWDQKGDVKKQGVNLIRTLATIDPRSPDAEERVMAAVQANAEGAETNAGRMAINQWGQRYNRSAVNDRMAFSTRADRWSKETQSWLDGYPGWVGLLDPGKWQQKYDLPEEYQFKDKDGNLVTTAGDKVYDKKKKQIVDTKDIPGATPKDEVTTYLGIGSDKKPYWITKPASELKDRVDYLNQLHKDRDSLRPQMNYPGYGIRPHPMPNEETMTARAMQALQDPNATARDLANAKKWLNDHGHQAAGEDFGPLPPPSATPEASPEATPVE